MRPHKAYGDHLADEECQKELSYLAVKVLGDCEFGDCIELHHATEECQQGQGHEDDDDTPVRVFKEHVKSCAFKADPGLILSEKDEVKGKDEREH